MVCVFCGKKTKVINSRRQVRSNQVWRRRQCQSCNNSFTSFEVASEGSVLMIKGRSSTELQAFSRDKLFISLYESCKHRPNVVDDSRALTATVSHKSLKQAQNAILSKDQLQATIILALKRFDPAAAVHYQAYYLKT